MADYPIIFSAPMVRALLDGRKTQTRRLAYSRRGRMSRWWFVKAGDRLWVREAWRPVHSADPSRGASYRANVGADQTLWRPSIHMPRWASRLTLVVTEARRQWLQDISEEDARAEGLLWERHTWHDPEYPLCDIAWRPYAGSESRYSHPRDAFADLWESIHGPDAWNANPEVIALTFTVHRCNIDAMEAEHAA